MATVNNKEEPVVVTVKEVDTDAIFSIICHDIEDATLIELHFDGTDKFRVLGHYKYKEKE